MDARSERIARRLEVPMLIASLLTIPLLVIEASDPTGAMAVVADILNWGTWLAFVAELVIMLAVVPDRWRWIREHPIDVVVTIITPPVLPAALASARLLRLLRVLRVLRLAPFMRALLTPGGLRYTALLAFLALLVGATAFADVEPGVDEWDGVWWGLTTMTTVGYGDIYPHTTTGRIIALLLMVIGIGLGTLLIGTVAERFVARNVEDELRDVELTDEQLLAEIRAVSERLTRIESAVAQRRR